MGEGKFTKPNQVIGFVKCRRPGRPLVANVGMMMKLSEMKPDAIHFSTCLVSTKPGCPYSTPEEMATMIQTKTGIPVIMGTHDYH